ncbi:MAG: hypothetical protein GY832_06690 [Chloroflexi bacterium]|nr:hypothetical protein [Chloroflexota bacterium]
MKQPDKRFAQPDKDNMRNLVLLILYALGVGIYFVFRFGGNWMEIDTARLTRSAQGVFIEATVAPAGKAYDHGFSYPVTIAWLAHLTGVSVLRLQTIILPVAGMVTLTLAAAALFQTVLGKSSLALLATLLLYLQADFLFVTSRGSHEKLTWPLAMVAILLLYRSATRPQGLKSFAIYVVLFYLTIYAMISTNSFFASTLITAILVSFLLGLAINKWHARLKKRATPDHFQRLAIISASSMILLYLSLFYLYAPARNVLSILPTMVDRIATLLLGFQPQANPYAYIGWGWVSSWVYFGLTLLTWLLLFGSLVEWICQGYQLLRGAKLHLPEALPWLLYAGFAAQVGVATVMDFAGVLSANLQLRVLPGLTTFAVILAVQGLHRLLFSSGLGSRVRRLLCIGFALLIVWFVFASLLKATNDPVVSNKWSFYHAAERAALQWTNAHLQHTSMWVGMDERLSTVYSVLYSTVPGYENIVVDTGAPPSLDRYFLLSETERLRHTRLKMTLPMVASENQVYDNGETQLYYKRPQTPYQR